MLHEFSFSHLGEKVRWALAWKQVPYRRRDYLPGVHAQRVKWLTGQARLPFLQIGGRQFVGSAAILDELERLWPEPPLYPSDPALRARAIDVRAHFDRHVAPRVRRVLFSTLLLDWEYTCKLFAGRKRAPVRAAYRLLFPAMSQVMGRARSLFDESAVAEAFAVTREALDLVASSIGPSGQLVGDSFSIADLTAAATFALLVPPDHPDMAYPAPVPESIQELTSRFESHPAARWAREQYRLHRPTRTQNGNGRSPHSAAQAGVT